MSQTSQCCDRMYIALCASNVFEREDKTLVIGDKRKEFSTIQRLEFCPFCGKSLKITPNEPSLEKR